MADRKEAFNRDIKDPLDRELDAALAKYVAVEPRGGLEDRVLANLRSKSAKDSRFAASFWYAARALVVVIVVVALALAWRSSLLHAPPIATHHGTEAPSVIPSRSLSVTEVGTNGAHSQRLQPPVRHGKPGRRTTTVAAANPKLERFPSPQPLSAQEQILQDYVADYPEHAELIARARSEELLHDAEEMRASGDTAVDTGR